MSKRIKRVFSKGEQVLHLWANQSQDSARSRNVFFHDDTCYSYGHHYKLGKLHKIKGQTIALINNSGYSSTTGKHIGQASSAASHLPTLQASQVDDIDQAIVENKAKLETQLKGFFKRISFWKDDTADQYLRDINEFNSFCIAVKKSKYKIKVTTELVDQMNTHIKHRLDRQVELDAQKNDPVYIAKKQAALVKKEEKALEKIKVEVLNWKQGGQLTNAVRSVKFQLLRIKGNTVETSKGASVPLIDATNAFEAILLEKIKSGDAIGQFRFNSIDDQGVIQIGCHRVLMSEACEVFAFVKSEKDFNDKFNKYVNS